MSLKQVCVVGAGIIGLSVATHLLESYHSELVVTVIADKFTPDTTASDIGGGIILAPIQEDKQRSRIWIRNSTKRFRMMYDLGGEGISYLNGTFVSPPTEEYTAWFKDLVSNYQPLEQNNESENSRQSEKARFGTFIVAGTEYMSVLLERIKKLGGVFVRRKVESLSDLNSFDVVINCAGLGARELACDSAMYPSKGILLSVRAPWVKEWYNEAGTHDGRAYVFPRVNEVILGGRNISHQEDLMVDSNEVKEIFDRCVKIMPSLANVDALKVLVGIRPMRKGGVRLEKEYINDTVVIHNYGHGSYGITLSWGCAEEVGDIVGQTLGLVKKPFILSKL